jgi:hypothetical protein
MTFSTGKYAPIFDVHPLSGASIEVFYRDHALDALGTGRAGWFWWSRRRGFSPESPAIAPFPTGYAAYRHALTRSETGCEHGFASTLLPKQGRVEAQNSETRKS